MNILYSVLNISFKNKRAPELNEEVIFTAIFPVYIFVHIHGLISFGTHYAHLLDPCATNFPSSKMRNRLWGIRAKFYLNLMSKRQL